MTIHVTAEHIMCGEKRRTSSCPIALAATDQGLQGVEVGLYSMRWGTDGQIYCLPKEAINFREAFDEGEQVSPFSFEIPDDN